MGLITAVVIKRSVDFPNKGKRRVRNILHLIHSLDPATGGVLSAVQLLSDAINELGGASNLSADSSYISQKDELVVAHGLWQWPGIQARAGRAPYIVFPHGMMDPWFRRAYPLKHLKKQIYWWYAQRGVMQDADAVCFTTEEEKRLAQDTFFPYRPAREIVTGIGVSDPPYESTECRFKFLDKHPHLNGKRLLLYLGRIHPKKGLDTLIKVWSHKKKNEKDVLLLAGPIDRTDPYHTKLLSLSEGNPSIEWLGMIEGEEKWGALSAAEALILPSHQENFGMVVAEACSVGTPVLLTNKVNLWSEIDHSMAGFVASDDEAGIFSLLDQWIAGIPREWAVSAHSCFKEKLHVRQAARHMMRLAEEL